MIYLRRLLWLVIMPITCILGLITLLILFCSVPIGGAIHFIVTGEFGAYIDKTIKISIVIDDWIDRLGRTLLN